MKGGEREGRGEKGEGMKAVLFSKLHSFDFKRFSLVDLFCLWRHE
jgi:hypothetical protein